MTDRYAVVGNPIAHSKSPLIHAAFAKQTAQDILYDRILAPLDGFKVVVRDFFNEGGKGLNITVPFKLEAFDLADQINQRAQLAGASNTLIKTDQGIIADNTDGVGLVRDLQQNCKVDLKNRSILVLGAGGAVQGVLGPILDCKPAKMVIANRTACKAEKLAELFSQFSTVSVHGGGYDEVPRQTFDVVINGTAASLSADIPPIDPVNVSNASCYDMMYALDGTSFTHWAQQHGAKAVFDGIGMLVEQAAESFYLWRGVRPETRPVIEMLKKA